MIDLEGVFEKYDDEYLKFDEVVDKLHVRPDMCAFLLLDKLVPPKPGQDMIDYATHDEFYLSVDCVKLAEVATEEDIITLQRCGVRYDGDSLCMFA